MKFLHISDLHYDPVHDGRTSRNLREELIKYLKEQNIVADELLITGDYRYAATQRKNQDEIDKVVQYINRIAETIGVEKSHIHIIPGNHDCDRNDDDEERISKIRGKYDTAKGVFDENDLLFLTERFEYFRMVCNSLYQTDTYWPKDKLHTYQVSNNTVFLCLNTAIMHSSDTDRKEKRLVIGNDILDQLLDEINKEYPEYPIIILAHHSPDLFEKHEKEAVESILRNHTNIQLYLCGDSHEAWPRPLANTVEITMGSLKQETGAEETFMYGDTNTQEYKVYHWAGAWESYTKYTQMINSYLCKDTVDETSDISSSSLAQFKVELDLNGELLTEHNLRNDLAFWFAHDKTDDVCVTVTVRELESYKRNYEWLLKKANDKLLKNKEEQEEFQKYKEQVEFQESRKRKAEIACELFLKDKYVQIYSGINKIDDYIRVLVNITRELVGCGAKIVNNRTSKEPTPLQFFCHRTDGSEVHFSLMVEADKINHDGIFRTDKHGMNASYSDLYYIDDDTRLAILTKFYEMLAVKSMYDSTILSDKNAMNIYEYKFGIS
ncbi:metallophosphoesterase family protein [Butyrivibrio fibrisolvens]|uniref:metallophosphoesterase family protein n=1 Tax=Butyrivibrio fibrisolvens TaxID=831 RepID=UPI0003F88F30|nr:metallophosphoesterase [Butyrivibrio fibrisolvens]